MVKFENGQSFGEAGPSLFLGPWSHSFLDLHTEHKGPSLAQVQADHDWARNCAGFHLDGRAHDRCVGRSQRDEAGPHSPEGGLNPRASKSRQRPLRGRPKQAATGAGGGNLLARVAQQQKKMGKLYFGRKKQALVDKDGGGDVGAVAVVSVCKKDLQMEKKDADVYTKGGQEQVRQPLVHVWTAC